MACGLRVVSLVVGVVIVVMSATLICIRRKLSWIRRSIMRWSVYLVSPIAHSAAATAWIMVVSKTGKLQRPSPSETTNQFRRSPNQTLGARWSKVGDYPVIGLA
jgi:hypothetical protein